MIETTNYYILIAFGENSEVIKEPNPNSALMNALAQMIKRNFPYHWPSKISNKRPLGDAIYKPQGN